MVSPVSQQIESGRVVQLMSDQATQAQPAFEVAPQTHDESRVLMAEEARRTLALFESLSDADWDQPTACTGWDVHDVAAHLVGESAGYATWREFFRLYLNLANKRRYFSAKMPLIDALNQLMVDDRAHYTPAELISELRAAAPRAINTRHRLPAFLRALRMPLPLLGTVRLDYLTDIIYPRDTWMHRVDILRAANRPIQVDATHDARLIELVIRELALHLTPLLSGTSIILELNTPAGGMWQIGNASQPTAHIEMDLIEFMLLASGRNTPDQAMATAHIRGDQALGERALRNTAVPF